ncbi:MAG: hypothetical protein H6632_21590 [Anaerolineales bacterium]|nr:hypothetical protein [Anaerolineales bacterium]
MFQPTDISLPHLRAGVHEALKLWSKPNDDTSPLSHLYLFHQAGQTRSANARRLTNDLLLQALTTMEDRYDAFLADLLRRRFLENTPVAAVANEKNIAEATAHKKQRQAIEQLADILAGQERLARQAVITALEQRLNLPAPTDLFGVNAYLKRVGDALLSPEPAWLVAIEGLGGIGKTALANAVIRRVALTHHFQQIAWVSAKQQEFWPGLGLQLTVQPALDSETLIDNLLAQLGEESPEMVSPQQKMALLTERLKAQPHLVVIDNLETIVDFESLLPLLARLANPSKFLLTSRVMPPQAGLASIRLTELSRADSFDLLRHEAGLHHMTSLAEASDEQLGRIYQVVGGHPLALKLVIGQLHSLPLSQVLDSLRQAQGKKVDDLYTFIYWQAWSVLAESSRQLLLVMPLVQNGTIDQLATTAQLTMGDLHDALAQLITLSLLEVSGTIDQRRYRIHRLTETFLLNEVVKWPKTP